jgi:hypothetical protein
VTGAARLGDFLDAAHRSLALRAGEPSPARGDVDEVSRSLLRVVTILGRYTQDTAAAFRDVPRHTPALSSPWSQAQAQARDALTNAAGFLLHPAASRPAWPAPPSASPLARRLDQMAAFLAAGRDLLHTHFAPGPRGCVHQSYWAPAITSERVNQALLAELGALAQPIAHYGANVALAPTPGAPTHAGRRRALNAACQWLWVLSASVDAADRQQPVPAADRDLLAAVPVNTLPSRPALTVTATIPGLCDGVITTAERLRHLAWQSAQQPPWTPALTVTSLRQAAEASALTSHHCAVLADSLAARAAQGAFPAAGPDLQHTLLGLGITSPALPARGADLDHASQRLLIEAADELSPAHSRPSATTLNETAASAALLNHVLASGEPQVAHLLRPPGHADQAELGSEWELEPEP